MSEIPENLTTSNPREIALAVLANFENRDTDAGRLLHDLLRRGLVRGADARLATELAMGVLRQRSRLDAVLEPMTRRPWRRTPPVVRDLLRLGAYQLLCLDRIPAHAAVNESVELARRWASRGQAALVNAILHRVANQGAVLLPRSPRGKADWPRFYSHPMWLVRHLAAHYPDDRLAALLEWNNRAPHLMLRANRLRATAERLADRLAAEGADVARVGWPAPESVALKGQVGDPASAPWYTEGWATIQDGAAQLIAHLVAPRPGERLVDWCAAPGGKAGHLAELSDDRASILACDIDERRLADVAVAAERLGLGSIKTYALRPELIAWLRQNPADAILVDAPCTGLGTIQRHPDIRWRRKGRDIERAARVQGEILDAAASCVAQGGRLIYCTCTLGPVENEDVVEAFLQRHGDFARDPTVGQMDPVLQPFLDGRGDLRTWPPDHQIDGFYAARLVRTG